MSRRFALFASLALAYPSAAATFEWDGRLANDRASLHASDPSRRIAAVARLAAYPTELIADQIMTALQDAVIEVRLRAADLAVERQLRRAIPLLVGWLTYWDARVRAQAAAALSALNAPPMPLIRALNDAEADVRLHLVRALMRLHAKQAVVPLIALLKDTKTEVRQAAVTAIGQLGGKEAVVPLMRVLDDPERTVRVATVQALRRIGDPRAARALLPLMDDTDTDVAEAAILALAAFEVDSIGGVLINMLYRGPYRLRRAAARALAEIGTDSALRSLAKALSSAETRAVAHEALVAAGAAASPFLAPLIDHAPRPTALAAVSVAANADLRALAPQLVAALRKRRLPAAPLAAALKRAADPNMLVPLLELLSVAHDHERAPLLAALRPIADQRAREPLLDLAERVGPSIQVQAIDILSTLDLSQHTSRLLALAEQSPSIEVARAVTRALASSTDKHAAARVIRFLMHRDKTTRRNTVAALAHIAHRTSTPHLLATCGRAMWDERVLTCIDAVGIQLRHTGDDRALAWLRMILEEAPDDAIVSAAIDALGLSGDVDIRATVNQAQRELTTVHQRLIAAAIGGVHRAQEVSPTLAELLRHSDNDVRAAAAWSSGKAAESTPSSVLKGLAKDHQVVVSINATAAVASRAKPRDVTFFLDQIGRIDPYVRANAVLGLGWAYASGQAPIAKVTCDTLADRIRSDRNRWVRLNAVRAARLVAGRCPDALSTQLAAAAAHDPDREVRQLAANTSPLGSDSATPWGDDWISLYLKHGNGEPLVQTHVIVVTPSGLIKAAVTDERGHLYERDLPRGHCRVERPAPSSSGGAIP